MHDLCAYNACNAHQRALELHNVQSGGENFAPFFTKPARFFTKPGPFFTRPHLPRRPDDCLPCPRRNLLCARFD